MLKVIARNYKDQAVILRGHPDVPFDKIVEVLNICQKAGIWNIAFAQVLPEIDETLPREVGEASANLASVRIEKDGDLYLDGKQQKDIAGLEAALREIAENSDELTVVVAADDEGPSAHFVAVIDVLARVGINNVTMTAFPSEEKEE